MHKTIKHYGGTSSVSYFDFVEQQADLRGTTSQTAVIDFADSSEDAFVVQVMDDRASQLLKREYFGNYEATRNA